MSSSIEGTKIGGIEAYKNRCASKPFFNLETLSCYNSAKDSTLNARCVDQGTSSASNGVDSIVRAH